MRVDAFHGRTKQQFFAEAFSERREGGGLINPKSSESSLIISQKMFVFFVYLDDGFVYRVFNFSLFK